MCLLRSWRAGIKPHVPCGLGLSYRPIYPQMEGNDGTYLTASRGFTEIQQLVHSKASTKKKKKDFKLPN